MTVVAAGDGREDETGGGGACGALVEKLQHPLANIRARALKNLLFKLRERLVGVAQLEAARKALVPRLLAALREPELELDALHVLELVIASGSLELLAALQADGAALELQRAAVGKSPELEAAYEKLLQKLLVTPQVFAGQKPRPQPPTQRATRTGLTRDGSTAEDDELPTRRQLSASQTKWTQQWARELPELEACGWRFAPVPLAPMDDQFLFEFEVKLTLRTTTDEIVGICRDVSRTLLRNFPAELLLQRPAVLQYLLHLVRQPLLSPTAGTPEEYPHPGLDQAMEISLGVNYFDALGSSTYSSKRGNLTGAVLMAAMTAIESFFAALSETLKYAMDPTLAVSESKVDSGYYLESHDHRRHFYPRTKADRRRKRALRHYSASDDNEAGAAEGFSLGGAVHKVFMNLLPLIRNSTHPRLHILNVLHLAVEYLKEKQADAISSVADKPNALDKQRLEVIFNVLRDVCRPISSGAATAHVNAEEELPLSVQWKLVDLVIRLLQLYPTNAFAVSREGTQESGDSTGALTGSHIYVPRELWSTVKTWISSPASLQIPSIDWNQADVVQYLSDLDGTIPAFVRLKHTAQKDVTEMATFVAIARHNAGAEFSQWSPSSTLSLRIAMKVLDAASIWKHEDAPAIANGIAFALWNTLSNSDGTSWPDEEVELMQRITSRSIGMMLQPSTEGSAASIVAAIKIFDHLRGLLGAEATYDAVRSEARSRFMRLVVCHQPVLAELLWAVALLQEDDGDQSQREALFSLWGMVDVLVAECREFTADQLQSFRTFIPVLQLLAYREASSTSAERAVVGQATRPRLAELLNRVEEHVSVCERLLLISRCLLHNSSYLRSSAASGIRRILSRDFQAPVSNAPNDSQLDDPFASSLDDDAEPDATWETKLVEYPLPSDSGDSRPNASVGGQDLSSQTRKLSNLCKIIRTTADLVQESALKELNLMVETATPAMVALFDELGETTKLFQLCHDALAGHVAPHSSSKQGTHSSLYPHALRLLRNLLFRSESLRNDVRSSADFLRDILPLLFDSRLVVRVQMYYIVLLMTCSVEYFVDSGSGHLANDGRSHLTVDHRSALVLSTTRSAFGLYASRWSRCGVRVVEPDYLAQSLTASRPKADVAWLQAVQTAIKSKVPLQVVEGVGKARYSGDNTNDDGEATSGGEEPAMSWQDYDFIVNRLRDAPSHGKFLNGIYHLTVLCHASRAARGRLAQQWESIFERYFNVEPKSQRDEVIVGAVVHAVGAILPAMTRSDQLRLLLVVKRSLLPLLQRSKCAFFALELARLLLHLSESRVADLFPSLVVDTDIVACICANYSAVYSTDPVLHATMLQLFGGLVRSIRGDHITSDAPFHVVIRQRLVEMASPLVTIICRHRPPGSFLENDVFCAAVRCVVGVFRIVSHEELRRGSDPLQHTDASVVLDGSWCSRLIFHHSSAVRALGFTVLGEFASFEVQLRMLELAVSTASDEAESDLVRGQACAVVTKLLLLYQELSHKQQVEVAAVMNRDGPIANSCAKQLVGTLKSDKVLVQSAVAFTRLLRVMLARQDAFSGRFGSIIDALRHADEEHDLFPELVKALSLSAWSTKCDGYASSALQLRSCDPWIWRRAVLPSVLELTAEVTKILQSSVGTMGTSHARYLSEHTTLKCSLMELIKHTEESLVSLNNSEKEEDASSEQRDGSLLELHYGSLLQIGKMLNMLLEESTHSGQELRGGETTAATSPPTSGMEKLESSLVRATAKLMSVQHPIDFRIAFAGVVASVTLTIPRFSSLDGDATKALTSAVFDLFTETAELSPTASSSSYSETSLRGVSGALQALLESNQVSRRVVEAKRGLEFCMTSMKALFVAIRAEGGFGSARKSSTAADSRVLELSDRVSVHMNVLSSLIGADADNQQLAKTQRLPDVLLSNWTVMKAAHIRGSPLLSSAVRLLSNYTYRNDGAKASLAQQQPLIPSASTTADDRSIMSLLCDLALPRRSGPSFLSQQSVSDADRRDAPLRNAACDVLSAAVLNSECRKWMIKFGVVTKLVDTVEDRLKLAAQTRKTPECVHAEHLGRLLRILSALTSAEEGAAAIYASGSNDLALIVQDILQSTEPNTQAFGYLLVRNLALADVTKSHAAVWEDLLPFIVDACARHLREPAASSPPQTLEFLGDTLRSLVFDNQRLRASLLSRPALLRDLEEVVAATTGAQSSLERALRLVKG